MLQVNYHCLMPFTRQLYKELINGVNQPLKNIIMKNIKYLMLAFLLLAAAAGCKKGQEADFDENFHPRIIDNGAVFTTPNRIIFEGQSAVYSGLTFSPKPMEKTKISWTVDGVEVSTDTAYTFTPTAGGEFVVKVEATYNGQTATRMSKVLV
ncbi:MAG: hypothetical protein EOP48_30205, partial [Sphingobacteriales bacterium]